MSCRYRDRHPRLTVPGDTGGEHASCDTAERYGFEPGLPAALQTLTEQQRQAVLLVHGTGCTLAEAAATLDVSVSTLRNHLRRGLAVLRTQLGVEVQP